MITAYEAICRYKPNKNFRNLFKIFIETMNYELFFLYNEELDRPQISVGYDNELINKELGFDFNDLSKFAQYFKKSLGHIIDQSDEEFNELLPELLEYMVQNKFINLEKDYYNKMNFTKQGKEFIVRFHMV